MTKQKDIQTHLDNLKALTEKENVRYEDGTEFNIYDLKELIAKELTAIEEIQEEEQQVQTALTVDELERMGDMIADIIETIELYNHALNLVPHGRKLEQGELSVHYQSLYDLTDTMFQKNQKMMKKLDYIGYTLLENADAFEIENTRKKFI